MKAPDRSRPCLPLLLFALLPAFAANAQVSPSSPAVSRAAPILAPVEIAVTDPRVLQSWRADLGTHSIIFHRMLAVEPPLVPRRIVAAPALAPSTAPAKKFEVLALAATVYDRRISHVRWSHEGRPCQAFSNIDFHLLRGLGQVETEDTVYLLLLSVSAESTEIAGLDKSEVKLPALGDLSSERAEYLTAEESGLPIPNAAFAGMEALHRYFDTHRATLLAEAERREAAQREREEREAQPPPPADVVIQFWDIKVGPYRIR
jgi:hypothetical protein